MDFEIESEQKFTTISLKEKQEDVIGHMFRSDVLVLRRLVQKRNKNSTVFPDITN